MNAIQLCKKIEKSKSRFSRKIYTRLLRIIFSCDYVPTCKLGDGVILNHNGLGSVLWAKSIGDNTQIWQNVTLGAGKADVYEDAFPTIGKNVKIYTGSVVIGNITVGDGAVVGANSVVTHDVPPNAVVVGAPARVIRMLDEEPAHTHTHTHTRRGRLMIA